MTIPEKYNIENLDEFHLSFILSTISRQHSIYLNHQLQEYNITAGEYPIIMKLYKEDKKTQKHIAQSFGLTEGSIARTLRHLEDKRIIKRKINQKNRRQNFVYLSKKGMKIASIIEDVESKWEENINYSLNKDEFKKLKETLYYISIESLDLNK